MAASSFPVLRRGSLNARERLEEAERLLTQAVREAMPKQLVTFLEGKVLEARAEVREEEIAELRERSNRLKVVEATPSERETMERYMDARRKGFGSRIAPVPPSLDREDAEVVYGKSVELRKMTTSRKVPPGTVMSSEGLDRAMKEMYAKTQREVDKQVLGILGAVDRENDYTATRFDPVERSAPPKAQREVAQVAGKRKISLDE